jgi:hypothetical protein
VCRNASQKPFWGAKPTCFHFSSSDFHLHGHIMITTGVALTKPDPPLAIFHTKRKLPS